MAGNYGAPMATDRRPLTVVLAVAVALAIALAAAATAHARPRFEECLDPDRAELAQGAGHHRDPAM